LDFRLLDNHPLSWILQINLNYPPKIFRQIASSARIVLEAEGLTTARKMGSGGAVLGVGYLIEHSTVLVRNVFLARLLGPETFGVAATFLIVVSSFSLISDLGIEKYLVRTRSNSLDRVQANLQSVLLLRGFLGGGLILVFSEPIAALFGHPEMRGFYALAALIPIIDGFKNLDVYRQQREMEYIPWVLVQLGSIIPGAALAILLAGQTGSAIAVAWASVVSTSLTVALSHLVARTQFRLQLNRLVLFDLLDYGWPLLLNGALIFLGSQGDRILVGAMVGMVDLAEYFAAGALTLGASLFLLKVTGALYVPLLASAGGDGRSLLQKYKLCNALTSVLCLAVFVPMMVVGAPLVRLLYGPEFEVPTLLVGFLAVQAGARVMRSTPIALSLTLGSTRDLLYVSIIRSSGLGLAYASLLSGHGLVGVAASMAAAEIAAMVFAQMRGDRRLGMDRHTGQIFGLLFMFISGSTLGLLTMGFFGDNWLRGMIVCAVILSLSFSAVLILSPEMRRKIRELRTPSRQ
jgi:O-antigen/teichoic acid export membrane protein